jgi:hypothetical protein
VRNLLAMAVSRLPPFRPTQAAENKAKIPEQACQAQALASIRREWSNVLRRNFEIILKGNRCLVLLQAPASTPCRQHVAEVHRRAGPVALFHHSIIRVAAGASGFFTLTQSAHLPDL